MRPRLNRKVTMNQSTNDNKAGNGALRDGDAQGQAALLLVESLIHSLIARSLISVEDAIEIVAVATDAATEIDGDLHNPSAAPRTSLTMLKAISQSLSHDV